MPASGSSVLSSLRWTVTPHDNAHLIAGYLANLSLSNDCDPRSLYKADGLKRAGLLWSIASAGQSRKRFVSPNSRRFGLDIIPVVLTELDRRRSKSRLSE